MRILIPALLAAVLSTPLAAQDSSATQEFYPTAVGTEWVYKAGAMELVERITKREMVNGEECLRVETYFDGKPIAHEHLAVRKDGIYRVSIAGTEVKPPLCFLKYTARLGEHWDVKSQVKGTEIAGKFTLGQETVELPAGKYRAVTVKGSNFKSGDAELEFTYYFVAGMGKVQQVVKANGQEAVMALKEFHPVQ